MTTTTTATAIKHTRKRRASSDVPPFRVITLKDGRHQVVDRDQKNRGTWPATPEGEAEANKHCAELLKGMPACKR